MKLSCNVLSLVITLLTVSTTALSSKPSDPQGSGKKGSCTKPKAVNDIVDLEMDRDWYPFVFGAPGEMVDTVFRSTSNKLIRISLTDAFWPGDAFDLFVNGTYLLSTPRVEGDLSGIYNPNPNETFWTETWSSTKFMIPGPFNLTIRALDSPRNNGTAYIRAQSVIERCAAAVSPFILLTSPLATRSNAEGMCGRAGATLAHITPENAADAAATLAACTDGLAWFGRVSLAPQSPIAKVDPSACLALNALDVNDPTVSIIDCEDVLPVICLPAA